MKVQPYFVFDGNCLEALSFYSELFNAEVQNSVTYKAKNIDVPLSYQHKMQHAELIGKGIHLMAYDAAPDTPFILGNNININVNLNNVDEAEDIFKSLSNGGIIYHEFSQYEWGYFGKCTDKYGIDWMINCAI